MFWLSSSLPSPPSSANANTVQGMQKNARKNNAASLIKKRFLLLLRCFSFPDSGREDTRRLFPFAVI